MTVRASIVIPTRNGGQVWRDTLQAVLRQRTSAPFELVVIDTASDDGTYEVTERWCGSANENPNSVPYRIERITPTEFGHGRTRNLGARMAAGEYVVYLSQDATPRDEGWLAALLSAFEDPKVVAAFCRQVPQAGVRAPERYILESAYPRVSSLRTRDSLQQRDAGFILFSNAASAIRRKTLLDRPFREDLLMCEDAHWAVETLRAGELIAYVGETSVTHSHRYTLRAVLARNFDFAVTLEGLPGSLGMASYARYLRREAAYVWRRHGVSELPWMAAFEAARCVGYLLGDHHRRLPRNVCRSLSAYPQWFPDQRQTHHTSPTTTEESVVQAPLFTSAQRR